MPLTTIAIKISSPHSGAVRFEKMPNTDGHYSDDSIDVTATTGEVFYRIGKDTSVPYNSEKDVISFWHNNGAYICGGQSYHFADSSGTTYADIAAIIADLGTFFLT